MDWVDGVDDSAEVVAEEEGVGAGAEESTRAPSDDWLAIFGDEEAGDEVFGRVGAGGGDANDSITGA